MSIVAARKFHITFFMAYGLGIILAGRLPAADGLDVIVAPATSWVKRDANSRISPPEERRIQMRACRNGHDGFQVGVIADGKPLRGVNAVLKDGVLRHADGQSVLSAITLYRECHLYVTTATGMHPERYPEGEFPDPLIPFTDPYSGNARSVGAPFDVSRIGSVGKSWRCLGDGDCFSGGNYTGQAEKFIAIEIDGEGELGQATFRWSDEWNGQFGSKTYLYYMEEPRIARWNAERILCSAEWKALGDGIAVRFTGGQQKCGKPRISFGKTPTDANFKKGDRYYLKAYRRGLETVYGDLFVPSDAKPGDYTGALVLSAEGVPPLEIPVRAHVYDIMIPVERNVDTAFGGPIDNAALCYHRGDPDQTQKITRNYEEMVHSHRLDYEFFAVTPEFRFSDDGTLQPCDWAGFDAAAGPRLDGSYFADKAPMRRFTFDISRWLHPGSPWLMKGPQHDKRLAQMARETAKHLKEKGWFSKAYVYCLDEPSEKSYPDIVRDVRIMKEADPDWDGKFMCTVHPYHGSPLLGSIDIWCPTTFRFGDWSDYAWRAGNYFRREDYAEKVIGKGDTFWLYVANYPMSEPYMSYQLDRINCHEPYLLKWASWYEGASGFLFWCVMGSHAATPNPYTNPWYSEAYNRNGKGSGTNGDAFLLYPGDRNGTEDWKFVTGHGVPFPPLDGPIPSLRLKLIRNGLEDWEMFLIGERRGLREKIKKEMSLVYQRLGSTETERQAGMFYWCRNDAVLLEARDRIARLIETEEAKRK